MNKSNPLRDIFHKNGLTYSEVGNPDGTTNPTYVSMGLDGFNEAITQIIALVDSKVIGEDVKAIYIDKYPLNTDEIKQNAVFRAKVLNRFKIEMRTNLKKLMGDK